MGYDEMTATIFKERYLSLHAELYQAAYKLMGDKAEAEDAVQTLYMRLWERRALLKKVDDDRAYCHKMIENICCDRWRSIARDTDEILLDDVPDESSAVYEIDDFERFARQYINDLPEVSRRVMKMRVAGATTDEIVNHTGVSATNVRTILSRVRMKLKTFYK